jgi:hypothetical protein
MVAVLLFDLYLLISSWLCLIPIPNRLYYLDLLIVIRFVNGSGGFFCGGSLGFVSFITNLIVLMVTYII